VFWCGFFGIFDAHIRAALGYGIYAAFDKSVRIFDGLDWAKSVSKIC
jgi:hypothetical protein